MYSFNELAELFEASIQKLDLPKEPKLLYQPIEYTLANAGKRLRPVMCLMAANLFSDKVEDALEAAKAIEVFHNFTLLHDDLMDQAPIRRGEATVYKKWNDNIAILSGDAMLIKAYQVLEGIDTKDFKQISNVFSKFALEVCEGQQHDMDFEDRMDVSLEEYINMIRLKTSVLFAGAMQIGAILYGATEKEQEALYSIGLNFGLGFQLQDDYLDSFGDVKTFGKKIGGDIIANKKTFLLIKALEEANSEQLAELNFCISSDFENEQEKIDRVKNIYSNIGVDQEIKSEIAAYFNKALDSINNLEVNSEKKKTLVSLIDKLMDRNK